MLIEVFGPGCPKCNTSADVARKFLEGNGIDGEVVKRTSLDEITARGVFLTPAVYADGEKVVEGRVLRERDLRAFVTDKR